MVLKRFFRLFAAIVWPCLFFAFVFLLRISLAQSPENELKNPDRFFSPNLDGNKDFFPIPLQIGDKNISHWRVEILSKSDKKFVVVKVFESIDEKQYGGSSLDNVFSRSSQKKPEPPKKLFWDGFDERGKKMQDGIYYLRFYITHRQGRRDASPPLPFVLDTVAPKPTLKWQQDFFSPNGDGVKDIFLFQVTNKNYGIGDMLIVRVFDKKGKEVRSFFEKAKSSSVVWDGLSEAGEPCPEGRYFVEITLKDMAGNAVVLPKKIITLSRKLEKAQISLSQKGFSPNDDGEMDTIVITPKLSSVEGLSSWQIDIKKDKDIVHQIVGEKKLPNEIVFDGKTKKGKVLEDGLYDVVFSALFLSGNHPFSEKKSLKVDTKAPKVSVKILGEKSIFRVDGGSGADAEKNQKQKKITEDSEKNEEEKIDFRVEQKAKGEDEDSYYVFVEDEKKKMVYKKQYKKKIPQTFFWDGKNELDSVVAGRYVYYLVGKDNFGNVSAAHTKPFLIVKGDLDMQLISSRLAFSPNGDGIKDTTVFILQMDEKSLKSFASAEIKIFDEKKEMVKQFDLKDYQKETLWGGLDEKGNILPDGRYFFHGQISLVTGEKIDLPRRPLYIDRAEIKIKLFADAPFFSPNGDGYRDDIALRQTVVESEILPEYDHFSVSISDEKGKIIRENAWSKDLPRVVRWNGKDREQKVLPDGVYHYAVFTEDEAGNRKKYLMDKIHLSSKDNWIELALSTEIISTLEQAKKNVVEFRPQVSSQEKVKKVDYFIRRPDGPKILVLHAKDLSPVTWYAARPLPREKDGEKIKKQSSLTSGKHAIYVEVQYENGKIARSQEKEILIDNDFPVNGVAARNHLFSPDGDGHQDVNAIRFLAKDNDIIASSRAFIFRRISYGDQKKKFAQTLENYQKNSVPFMSYDLGGGKELDQIIYWDGLNEKKELVESATDYVLFLENEDRVGLRKVAQTPINIDVLVEKLDDGRLKIILNSIKFKYDSVKMTGDYAKVLKKLVNILNKFHQYKIKVVGHTDSRGTPQHNKKLSVKRAKAVRDFLVRKGKISPQRLSFDGMGKEELLIADEVVKTGFLSSAKKRTLTQKNYRKNRRVEFYLKKDE